MIFMICRGGPGRASRYHRAVPSALLYPDPPLLRSHPLPVGDGHVLRVQEFGRPDGLAALVLHGGPGSGCSPLLRRYFDPARYRIVCVDQRGAGASQPRGATAANTTAHLVADLRRVRQHLALDQWLVVGGSWGAALAIAYAEAEPRAVTGLLLRASFLARREDIIGFFSPAAAGAAHALTWHALVSAAATDRADALLPALAQALSASDRSRREQAALAWWRWELAVGGQAWPAQPVGAALAALVDRYRVQSHYLLHDCWLAAPSLLERCANLPQVPTLLLHARDDRVCPAAGAQALAQRLPHARLQWLEQAGHDAAHPAMVDAMVTALDGYAAQGDFAVASASGVWS